MAHCLIVGMTGAGKTTWARKKAHSLQRAGRTCIILDPFKRSTWVAVPEHAYVTDDEELFLKAIWENRECAIFIDESGDMVGKYNDLINSVATKSRNFGHKCYFIMQRQKQISTTIRTQCSEIVVFKSSRNDTKDLADEFVADGLNQACELEMGEFLHTSKGGKPVKYNVFKL